MHARHAYCVDVYPPDGDLSFLDIKEMKWRAVDCPVDGLPIQYAFSTDTSNQYYFAFQVRRAAARPY